MGNADQSQIAADTGFTITDSTELGIGQPPYPITDMHDLMRMEIYAQQLDDGSLCEWFRKGAETYDPKSDTTNHLILGPIRLYPIGRGAEQIAIAFIMAARSELQWPARVMNVMAADAQEGSKTTVMLKDIIRESTRHGDDVVKLAQNAGLQHLIAA